VEIRAVRKVFGAIEAIKSISFAVADGEFVSVLGPSGCGKTSLLLLIAGLTSPTEGDVRIDGVMVTRPQRATGVVFQTPVRLPTERYRRRALELLRIAKIDDFADVLPRQLSGGMRQRAAICRALVHEPSLLLMDEPFSALDAITRDEMGVELMRIWHANRKTVVFVTHSNREAPFPSDRVLVMGHRLEKRAVYWQPPTAVGGGA
jgi:NitT/TauT family transport system ATP-binding protein